jgi:signal transduction histidine kinase
MNTGIKRRLSRSYLLLIVITVILFESIILFALRSYYLEGIKQTLRDQGIVFSSFYKREIIEGSLDDQASVLLQSYQFLMNAQVQIINIHGDVIADTHAHDVQDDQVPEDVLIALGGETGIFKGRMGKEKVMAVSQPIMADEHLYGAIRMITSLERVNVIFKQNTFILAGIGILVILIAAAISYFLAGTITKPLGRMTRAAEQMAAGKFSVRMAKEREDELGKLADTLNFMAEQVEKHERLKNEFIASVSHELRTPLTSVKGWAITLHAMSDDKLFKEGLEIISNESERLSLMLGDLLDVASLSAGKTEYCFEELSLRDLLLQVITQLTPRSQRQGVAFSWADDADFEIIGDKNRLKQVFINVLDNALKFTPAGGTIAINAEVKGHCVCVEVSDTGAGIPADELHLVKEKFHKGKSKASGTGLGLAICQEIIKAHHGTIDIKSTDGEGTIVEILLPLIGLEVSRY